MNDPIITMAPMRGFNDAIYRNTFSDHFGGVDLAVAPFVSTTQGRRIGNRLIKDLLPDKNTGIPVVPQLLSKSPEGFVAMARRLFDLGYATVNWNLGCPYPMVANKGRGAGLLPYPDRIDAFLEAVMARVPTAVSVKVRLGRYDREEIFALMPVFNRFPLTEVIVHPRTGVQMYAGTPDLGAFERCLHLSTHPVVYNGDIDTPEVFFGLVDRFASVDRWMIGRGLLADPFLAETIRSRTPPDPDERIRRLSAFHDALYAAYAAVLCGPGHLLDRMKGLWSYMAKTLEKQDKFLKSIRRARSTRRYETEVGGFFEAQRPQPVRRRPHDP